MPKSRPLARFEEHSLALFAALAMGGVGTVAQAREHGGLMQVQAPISAPAARSAQHAAFQRANAAFDRADANGDGQLSRAEAQRLPAVAERFDEIDSNGDKQLSREEFQRGVID
ncbi:EF-hand domain-containing protein [Pseudorhodoferax sp.]|uniref:EF-hand domain-containing protein n=1 Tax=Pseudorhodoferax sp. TaxID=1993553 RepID=UPI002DD6A8E9|nr:EF-hand domain-containing protein [Pseudorhodoferax sp.]